MSMFGEIAKAAETVVDKAFEGKGLGIAPILSETLKDMNSILKDSSNSLNNTANDLLPALNLEDKQETQSKPHGIAPKIGEVIAPLFDGALRGTFPKISEVISETAETALEGLKPQELEKSASEILNGESLSEKANMTLSPEQEENARDLAEKLYGKTQTEFNEMSALLKESMKNRSKLMTSAISDLK